MNSKLFNLFKNKVALTVALLTCIILGAGTMVAMKAPNTNSHISAIGHHVTQAQKAHKKFTTYYFQYSGNDTEAAYETASNWSYLSSGIPGTSPCSGSDYVCVLNTDDIASPTAADLVTYLSSLPSAQAYCQDADHESYKQGD